MKIVKCKSLGIRSVFSLEMAAPHHNYVSGQSSAVHANSHAVAYCLVAYICLWMKQYFPEEFWAAVMSSCNAEKRIRYMMAARNDGVSFRSFDVCDLSANFDARPTAERRVHTDPVAAYMMPGLISINKVNAAAPEFAALTEVTSLEQMIEQTGKNKIVYERLIKLNAFNNLPGHSNAAALWVWYQYHHVTGPEMKVFKEDLKAKLIKLDGWDDISIQQEINRRIEEYKQLYPKRKKLPAALEKWRPDPNPTIERIAMVVPPSTLKDVLAAEEEFLGHYINSPLDLYKHDDRNTMIGVLEGRPQLDCFILDRYVGATKKGDPYARLTVYDGQMTMTLMAWSNEWMRSKALLRKGLGVTLMVRYEPDRKQLTMIRDSLAIPLMLAKHPIVTRVADAS